MKYSIEITLDDKLLEDIAVDHEMSVFDLVKILDDNLDTDSIKDKVVDEVYHTLAEL